MSNARKTGVRALTKALEERGLQLSGGLGAGQSFRIHQRDDSATSVSVRVYAGDGEFFRLAKQDLESAETILVYIWDADSITPSFFFVTPAEGLEFLGQRPQKTRSWMNEGRYNWSSASGLPSDRRRCFIDNFSERWNWLLSRL